MKADNARVPDLKRDVRLVLPMDRPPPRSHVHEVVGQPNEHGLHTDIEVTDRVFVAQVRAEH